MIRMHVYVSGRVCGIIGKLQLQLLKKTFSYKFFFFFSACHERTLHAHCGCHLLDCAGHAGRQRSDFIHWYRRRDSHRPATACLLGMYLYTHVRTNMHTSAQTCRHAHVHTGGSGVNANAQRLVQPLRLFLNENKCVCFAFSIDTHTHTHTTLRMLCTGAHSLIRLHSPTCAPVFIFVQFSLILCTELSAGDARLASFSCWHLHRRPASCHWATYAVYISGGYVLLCMLARACLSVHVWIRACMRAFCVHACVCVCVCVCAWVCMYLSVSACVCGCMSLLVHLQYNWILFSL